METSQQLFIIKNFTVRLPYGEPQQSAAFQADNRESLIGEDMGEGRVKGSDKP
jgi:hypothetical protein